MGLSKTIQNVAVSAFKAIGDILLVCTYADRGAAIYVPATGAYTYPDTINYTNLKFLFEDFSAKEITDAGGVILTTDQKASIPQLNLTPTPQIKDLITDSDSVVWAIENIKKDAAKAVWIFHLRRAS